MAEPAAALALGPYGPSLSARLGDERDSVLKMAARPYLPAELSIVALAQHANGELTPGAASVLHLSAIPGYDMLHCYRSLTLAASQSGFTIGFMPLPIEDAKGFHDYAGARAIVGASAARTIRADEYAAWAMQHALTVHRLCPWDWWRLAAPMTGDRPRPAAVGAIQAMRNLRVLKDSLDACAEAVGWSADQYRRVQAELAETVRGACRDFLGDMATGLALPTAVERFERQLPGL